MFSATVIVFREVFEMAIIITVILAATRQLSFRARWIGGGIAIGAMLVGIVACFAQLIVNFATRLGEHVFHAGVLFVAASLIAWSVIWMHRHGREIANQVREISQSIQQGQVPMYMLSVVVALAVLREGSEIVLFLYGIFVGGEASLTDLVIGFISGLGLGLLTGVVMYLGLIRVPVKQLFSISGWLLTFLAAGMAAKGVGHLVAANILPGLVNPLWDTSAFLSQKSLLGRFLSILIGYQDHPAGIQVLFYVATFSLISFAFIKQQRPMQRQKK